MSDDEILDKVPYMVVCDDKEGASGTVAPRTREGKQLDAMPLAEFAELLRAAARIPGGGALTSENPST